VSEGGVSVEGGVVICLDTALYTDIVICLLTV
jgi:hypothetical protein